MTELLQGDCLERMKEIESGLVRHNRVLYGIEDVG